MSIQEPLGWPTPPGTKVIPRPHRRTSNPSIDLVAHDAKVKAIREQQAADAAKAAEQKPEETKPAPALPPVVPPADLGPLLPPTVLQDAAGAVCKEAQGLAGDFTEPPAGTNVGESGKLEITGDGTGKPLPPIGDDAAAPKFSEGDFPGAPPTLKKDPGPDSSSPAARRAAKKAAEQATQ